MPTNGIPRAASWLSDPLWNRTTCSANIKIKRASATAASLLSSIAHPKCERRLIRLRSRKCALRPLMSAELSAIACELTVFSGSISRWHERRE
jgi:hypothetical protein